MKNKRLIAILSIFLVLVVIIVLCSTVFTVSTVTFSWKTEKNYLSEFSDESLAQNVPKGKSVFLLNKTEIINDLEYKYPYIKVINIETKFPNKLVVHASERVDLYAVALEDEKYAILDDDSKVLNVITAQQYDDWDVTKSAKPIAVNVNSNGSAYIMQQQYFVVGRVANVKRVTSLLSSVAKALENSYFDADADVNVQTTVKARIKDVTINIAYRSDVTFTITNDGMIMKIVDCYTNLSEKIALGKGIFDIKNAEHITTGKIIVEGTNVGDYYYEP